ncbi:MAG TPA: photosystem I reaction center subunit IV, partial [Algoriphagus sp.]|nr:photosystem I reaction center subunit IV [Algoriphagus sp.]
APRDVRIIVAVGENATSVRSANSGSSFARANLGATNTRNILGLSFIPGSNTVFASGQDGYLISSANAGSTYTQRLAGYRNNFTSVDFKTDRVGFVAGERGEFLVSSTSGRTFVSRPIPEQFTISAIDFWNTAFGYISGPGGKIYRTSNSGSAWGEFSINTTQRVDGFYLFAPSVLYLAGTNGFITRSSDSGGTWDLSVTSNSTTNLKDLMFFDFAIGIAIGENGLILYSFGGSQWEPVNSGTSRNLNGLAKLGEFQAIAVGDGGTII